jgi:hypothetical protein
LAQQLVEGGGLPPELQRPGLNIRSKGANFQFAGDDGRANLKLSYPANPGAHGDPGQYWLPESVFQCPDFHENGAPLGSGLSVKKRHGPTETSRQDPTAF